MRISIGKFLIRDWHRLDASSLAKHADNRHISRNLRDLFPHPYRLADAEAFLTMVEQQNPRTAFAIAADDDAIGGIGLVIGADVHRFTAEMGYWLAEPYWNKGIMTQAVKTLTQYGFETWALHRIFAEPYAHNSASAKVLEKAGFTCEGCLRASAFKEGKIVDQLLYAKVNEAIA